MANLETRRGYHPDRVSFGKFMLSEQARRPAVQGAREIAKRAAARAPKVSGGLARGYKVNRKPAPVTIGGNPRAIAEVYNNNKRAAFVEFGEAPARKARPQGGSRGKAQHPLLLAAKSLTPGRGLW